MVTFIYVGGLYELAYLVSTEIKHLKAIWKVIQTFHLTLVTYFMQSLLFIRIWHAISSVVGNSPKTATRKDRAIFHNFTLEAAAFYVARTVLKIEQGF